MQKDFSHIPPKYTGDVKVYYANSSVTLQGLQIWQKPKGASLVSMIVIGGGGGGGGGFSRTQNTAGGGGAGGASSGVSRFMCPAILLPDTLYIQVGNGGQGGAASANGGAGVNSYVLTSKIASTPNIILYSNTVAAPPGGGGAGTVGAGGTGGTVPGAAVTQPTNVWGEWLTNNGAVGAAGGAQTGAVGVSVTGWVGSCVGIGAGGAGCTTTDFAGGAQTTAILETANQGYYIAAAGGVAAGGTAAGVGVDGSAGVNRITPLFCSGGAGGGSNNTGQAGNGGMGGYGSGGGGGGAGTTGGRGGNGGSGLVIIITN